MQLRETLGHLYEIGAGLALIVLAFVSVGIIVLAFVSVGIIIFGIEFLVSALRAHFA